MNERQKEILAFVINEYVKSAQPISSSLLAEKSQMDLSPATYRNELAVLEEEGFLHQPYTSAGRVPTEKAYKFYVQNFLTKKTLKATSANQFKLALKNELEKDSLLKEVARQLVEKSDQAVILAYDKNNVYYTGLTNLLSKPEFYDQSKVLSITNVVDHLDKVVEKVFDRIDDLEILIGKSNPFGSDCSAILGKYNFKDGDQGMFAILGPMRMDYKKNLELMNGVKLLLDRFDN